ncbi:SDR family oxidoreductase [Paraburkholderia elongata]|uniref:SDR family oxidoreductase n=1 Tax=Paraburkholderia elongata TaxID=2675747 RepID=A0A972SN00_9BURK|nr:SDR family oxidoreductase [Paraburkholderia elongata]NPT57165.1 SDR family oxidoreductase [Paraburkholderia elongata]
MIHANPPEAREQLSRMIPMQRLGTPKEVASTAVFLASDSAGYVAGAELKVAGDI